MTDEERGLVADTVAEIRAQISKAGENEQLGFARDQMSIAMDLHTEVVRALIAQGVDAKLTGDMLWINERL